MSTLVKPKYKNKLKDSLHWWLGRKKPFIINDEYKLELLYIDRNNHSAKIKITNLSNNDTSVVDGFEVQDESN